MAGKQKYELWAEAIRDIGILLLVFVPLDVFLRDGRLTRTEWLIGLGFAVLGLLIIEIGVRIGCGI